MASRQRLASEMTCKGSTTWAVWARRVSVACGCSARGRHFSIRPDQWHDFFVMVGGAAAALTGLVFVALSLNLEIVVRDATHRHRAIGTLTNFAGIFVLCAPVRRRNGPKCEQRRVRNCCATHGIERTAGETRQDGHWTISVRRRASTTAPSRHCGWQTSLHDGDSLLGRSRGIEVRTSAVGGGELVLGGGESLGRQRARPLARRELDHA